MEAEIVPDLLPFFLSWACVGASDLPTWAVTRAEIVGCCRLPFLAALVLRGGTGGESVAAQLRALTSLLSLLLGTGGEGLALGVPMDPKSLKVLALAALDTLSTG